MPEELWRIGTAGKLDGDVNVDISAKATSRSMLDDFRFHQTVQMRIELDFPMDGPPDVEKWFTDALEAYLGLLLSSTVKRAAEEYKDA